MDSYKTENMCCQWDADSVGVAAETDDTVLGFHTADFWLNICVCHSLIVETKEGADRPTFQVFALHHDSILNTPPPIPRPLPPQPLFPFPRCLTITGGHKPTLDKGSRNSVPCSNLQTVCHTDCTLCTAFNTISQTRQCHTCLCSVHWTQTKNLIMQSYAKACTTLVLLTK